MNRAEPDRVANHRRVVTPPDPLDDVNWHVLDQQLTDLGYRHHVFLSFARGGRTGENLKVAKAFKAALEVELDNHVHHPEVFLDELGMQPGDIWPERLVDCLCHSACLAAVCVPIYFSPQKQWCSREWAGMEALSAERLPTASRRSIIPMLYRADPPLPEVFKEPDGLHYEDFSKVASSTSVNRFLKTSEGRARIVRVVKRIKQFAFDLVSARSRCTPDGFQIPDVCPFLSEPERVARPAQFTGYIYESAPRGGRT